MARRKKVDDAADALSELLELAQRVRAPDGFLDNELWDACQGEARLAYANIKDGVLLSQLEFLHDRGYAIGRLKEIIEEWRDA